MLLHLRHQLPQPVIQQAWVINNNVPLAFICLVDAENLRAGRGFYFICHLPVDEIFHRTFFPVREQLFTVDTFIFFADSKAVLRTRRELIQLFQQPVRVHFRRHNPSARFYGAVTGNQFFITNRNFNMFKDIRCCFRPAQYHRFAFGLPMAGGIKQRPLQRDFTGIGKQCSFEARDTIRHEELLWESEPALASGRRT